MRASRRPAGRGCRSDDDRTRDVRLYGVAGDTTLRVSKEGYQTHTQNLVVTDDTPSLAVALTLVRPRLDVSGAYTLTITADPSCSGGLLEPLRTRSYAAVLTQVGAAGHRDAHRRFVRNQSPGRRRSFYRPNRTHAACLLALPVRRLLLRFVW